MRSNFSYLQRICNCGNLPSSCNKFFSLKQFLLVFILFCFTSINAQKKTSKNYPARSFIKHKVSKKESFRSISSKYNITPQALAAYNNLSFYEGRLLANIIRIPLPKKAPNATSDEIIQPNQPIATRTDEQSPKSDSRLNASTAGSSLDSAIAPSAATSKSVEKVTPPPPSKPVLQAKQHLVQEQRTRKTHQRFSTPSFKQLFPYALVVMGIAFVLVGLIYFFLSVKKKRFFFYQRLGRDVEAIISHAILKDETEVHFREASFQMPYLLLKFFHKKDVRQLVIDGIVESKKSLTGSAAKNLIILYEELGLNNDSLKKLNSNKWFLKAKGIQELAIMDQSKTVLRIFRQTNSTNELVRMEAQSAIVHLTGFKGLKFLNNLSYQMSEWQQVKLIEQLSTVPFAKFPGVFNWLKSNNESVVIFTLKLIAIYRQFDLHNAVVDCLQHTNPNIRYGAIKCLKVIPNYTTCQVLRNIFNGETDKNKLAVLDAISKTGSHEELMFLKKQLLQKNDHIKLAAASALAHCCDDGMQVLKEICLGKERPYPQIFLHVKANLQV